MKVVVARRIRPGQTLPLKGVAGGSVTLIDDANLIETVPETVAILPIGAGRHRQRPSLPEQPPDETQAALYRRHLDRIAAAKNGELEQMRERLDKLLCGEVLLATREGRILERWKQINQVWDRTRRRLSRRVGVSADPLSMDQGSDYREKIEALHLLNTATPLESKMTSPAAWKMTLRGETSTFVPIGNIFSGLFCEVKSAPPGMIETIRKPTRGRRDDGQKPQQEQRRASGSSWRSSAAYQQRFHQLRNRIAAVRPHEIVLTDALEIVGHDLFDLRRSAPAYSADRESLRAASSEPAAAVPPPEPAAAASGVVLPLIVRLELSVSELSFTLSAAQSEAVSRAAVVNAGTTAVHFRFCRLPAPVGRDDAEAFRWFDAEFTILPGQSVPVAFRFAPARPGLAVLALSLEMFPRPMPDPTPPVLVLKGVKHVARRVLDERIRSFVVQLQVDADRASIKALIVELAERSVRDRIRLQAAMRSYLVAFVADRIVPLGERRAEMRALIGDVLERRAWPRCELYDGMRARVLDLVRDRVPYPEPELPN